MSCPSWPSLIAERQRSGESPEGWDAAVAHLDGCEACFRQAVRLEPSLVFRRMPAVTVTGDEVEEMRRRVALLRRVRQVERPAVSLRRRWPAAAAAVLLTVGLLGATHGTGPLAEDVQVGGSEPWMTSLLGELASQPVLEHWDQPFDQVVQWSSDELSMILLLDERLDV